MGNTNKALGDQIEVKPSLPVRIEIIDTTNGDIYATVDSNGQELSHDEVEWINGRLQQPTISDYLEANKEMLDKTGCKVVTIASLRKFGGLDE